MAYTFSVNNSPATGAVAMYTLISTLMSAGWLKKMDSDGTTYSSTGVQVTSGNAGTGGLGNTNAWVRLQAPQVNGGAVVNQTRELTIQRGTTDLVWRIKYSASALFTGGSPAAAVTPSSTDEIFMMGAATDASPTFYSWISGATGDERWHFVAGGAAEFYSFVAWSQVIGGLTAREAIFLDVMADGSYPAVDVDPAVVFCNSSTPFSDIAGFASSNVTNPSKARAWLGSTSAAGASLVSNNVNVVISNYGGIFTGGTTIGTNPWTNKEDLFPCLWGNQGTTLPYGIKGISTLFKMGTILHTNGTVSSHVGTRDKIYYGNYWLPWSGASVLI